MKTEEKTIFSREIRLKSRPTGLPQPDNFDLVQVTVPPPANGEVLVRNLWMSVDPYMRGRMNDGPSYIPPFEVDRVLDGSALGQVVESNTPDLQVGDYVTSFCGWREAFVAKATEVQRFKPIVPTAVAPIETHLSVLGTPG